MTDLFFHITKEKELISNQLFNSFSKGHKYIRKEKTSKGEDKYVYKEPQISQLREFFKNMLSFGLPEGQKKFFQWELDNSKVVNIEKINSNPELKKVVTDALIGITLKEKGCYYNAGMLSIHSGGKIKYVEGQISLMGIPIDHAWNSYNDIHFDITREGVWRDSKLSVDEYLQLMELNSTQVYNYMSETGVSGPFLINYFKESNKDINQE